MLLPDFRLPLAEIAQLTDWQIENEYLIPAQERAKQLEAEREGRPAPPTRAEQAETQAAAESDQPISRQYMVYVMTSIFGMSVEAANAEYDRQYAEWAAKKGTK